MKIHDSPYEFICDYAEEMFPFTGKKCFEIFSLMIPSLIAPDLPYKGKTIRSNINTLFLSPPGGGKTALSKLFGYFTYTPIEVESITTAKLEGKLKKLDRGTIIVGDFARMSSDKIMIKVLEQILGEEKRISRETMRSSAVQDVNMIGLLCGTPQDLSGYLTSGLIFRIVPCVIFHNPDEHEQIGAHINKYIGEEMEGNDKEQSIKDFYLELLCIQLGEHKEIGEIKGYKIQKSYKDEIMEVWNKMTKSANKETRLNFFRELQEAYRFLVSHAMLNIFERENKNGILVPNDDDLKVALKLMKENIGIKKKLLTDDKFARNIQTMKDLELVLARDDLNDEDKDLIRHLATFKGK